MAQMRDESAKTIDINVNHAWGDGRKRTKMLRAPSSMPAKAQLCNLFPPGSSLYEQEQ